MPLNDIIETTHQPALFLWWQWLALALGLLAVLLLIIFLIKKYMPTATAAPSAAQQALTQLQQLQQQSLSSSELATSLSTLVRHYLQAEFGDPALFETVEEFHRRSAQLDKLPAEASSRLVSYLDTLAFLKYAPVGQAQETQLDLVEQTSQLIRGLDSTVPRPLEST